MTDYFRDPHVVSLRYRIEPSEGVTFGDDTGPIERAFDVFHLSVTHEFYFLVTKNKAPRFCENPACGDLFFPTRSNQRHCYGAACRSNASYHRKAETV